MLLFVCNTYTRWYGYISVAVYTKSIIRKTFLINTLSNGFCTLCVFVYAAKNLHKSFWSFLTIIIFSWIFNTLDSLIFSLLADFVFLILCIAYILKWFQKWMKWNVLDTPSHAPYDIHRIAPHRTHMCQYGIHQYFIKKRKKKQFFLHSFFYFSMKSKQSY